MDWVGLVGRRDRLDDDRATVGGLSAAKDSGLVGGGAVRVDNGPEPALALLWLRRTRHLLMATRNTTSLLSCPPSCLSMAFTSQSWRGKHQIGITRYHSALRDRLIDHNCGFCVELYSLQYLVRWPCFTGRSIVYLHPQPHCTLNVAMKHCPSACILTIHLRHR